MDILETMRIKEIAPDLPKGIVWLIKGQIIEPELYMDEYPDVKKGDIEWRFCDGPPGEYGSSSDYCDLHRGLQEHSGYIIITVEE